MSMNKLLNWYLSLYLTCERVPCLWNIQHDKLDLENYLKQWIYCCFFSTKSKKKDYNMCAPLTTQKFKIVWYQRVLIHMHSGRKNSFKLNVLGLESRIMNASQLVNWIYNHYLVSIKSFSTKFSVNEDNEKFFNPFFDEKKILLHLPLCRNHCWTFVIFYDFQQQLGIFIESKIKF